MIVGPVPGYVSAPTGYGSPHGRLARWAVRLSAVFGAAFAASAATVAIAYAVGAEGSVEDTWLGALLFLIPLVGFVGSVAAFVMAIVAMARHEHWAWLWLPLGVLPAMIVFLALAEALLME
jgi:hypothetical protein